MTVVPQPGGVYRMQRGSCNSARPLAMNGVLFMTGGLT